jgi:UDP:flavonoid glycosyltransferase YjiC (YdhE family)
MRLLCCSAQLPSHLDWGGYLRTAAELARRGHTLLWVSGEAVAKRVTAAGVPFQAVAETGWRWPPPPPLPPEAAARPDWQRQRSLRALDQWLDETRVATALVELLAVAADFKPDAVVSEAFVAAAALAAEKLAAPLLVAGWPAFARSDRAQTSQVSQAQAELVAIARERLVRLAAGIGVEGRYWTPTGPPAMQSPYLHATYWSPGWYAGLALQPQTQHFGGSPRPPAAPDRGMPPPQQMPWVLITLGTTFNEDPNFYLAAAHAAARLGCLPIVVLGREARPDDEPWLRRLPPGTPVRSLIAFGAVLPYLAAAIHHGGAGTTHALVTEAVPQIVVPHAADQAYQAQGVVRSGIGLYLAAKDVTIDRLEAGLAALLPDLSNQRREARRLQTEFAALGGAAAAAEAIERNLL